MFLEFLYIKSCHLQLKTTLLLPFQLVLFISLSFLIDLARTSTAMLTVNYESEHPCLAPNLRRRAYNFSPLSMIPAVGLSYMALIMLRYVPSMTNYLTILIMSRCCILSNIFPASNETIIWFFSFILLMWCITVIDLCMLNNPCIARINPTWSWWMIF